MVRKYRFARQVFHVLLFSLTASLFFQIPVAYATTFYFSSSEGNDQNTSTQAQNIHTPWRSLDKLNAFGNKLRGGDTILFKRSDVFYGSIKINTSGYTFAPVYFGAYGKGAKPQINGLIPLKAWKSVGNGVYETDFTAPSVHPNTLLWNGAQRAAGRYPNKGYLQYETHDGNLSITDAQLNTNIDWNGGEVVIKKNRWTIDRSSIVSHINGTLSYEKGSAAVPQNNFGYFIQDHIQTLDELGEWFYDAERKKMAVFFGREKPSMHTVEAAAIATLINIRGFGYLFFDELELVGAGTNAFDLVNAANVTINNCTINFSGAEAIIASYSPNLTVSNTSINNSLSGGIHLDAGCTHASIFNNSIKNTGLFPGLGRSGTGTYEGITAFGDDTRIEQNEIVQTGYNGIYFGGNSSIVKNNLINNFCLTKDDGAGIYVGDWSKTYHKKITGNIVLNGMGVGEGTNNLKTRFAEGIYIDDNSESVYISGNTVSLCANSGIKLHNAANITVADNMVFNNAVQLRLEQDNYLASSSRLRKNTIRNNKFYTLDKSQIIAKLTSHQDDLMLFGKLDSNFMNNTLMVDKNTKYSAQVLKGKNGFFAQSILPVAPPAGDHFIFEFNASNLPKTIYLNGETSDIQNQNYQNKITLLPYTSILLKGTANTLKPQMVLTKK